MSHFPLALRRGIDALVDTLPRGPPEYTGYAIHHLLKHNLQYGADENIEMGLATRLPNELKHNVNCGDAAIGAFVMAQRIGLQSRLALFRNWEGSGNHMGTILGDERRQWIIHHFGFYRFGGYNFDLHANLPRDNYSYDSITYLDMDDVLALRARAEQRESWQRFFAEGQTLTHRYLQAGPLNVAITRFLQLNDGELLQRKTIELPGIYMHLARHKGQSTLLVSAGCHHRQLDDAYLIAAGSGVGDRVRFNDQSTAIPEEKQKSIKAALLRARILPEFIRTQPVYREGFAEAMEDIRHGVCTDPYEHPAQAAFATIRACLSHNKSWHPEDEHLRMPIFPLAMDILHTVSESDNDYPPSCHQRRLIDRAMQLV